MERVLLALNAGSSSIKFALYSLDAPGDPVAMCRGGIEDIGDMPRMSVRFFDGRPMWQHSWTHGAGLSHEALLKPLLAWIETQFGRDMLAAAAHRVVHGGGTYSAPVLIDEQVRRTLEHWIPLAPLHQPHNLAAIDALAALCPDLPQVACFDTAFHGSLPERATRLPLPREYAAQGLRRYGFHGLSYEYIGRQLQASAPRLVNGRVVAAHLGNGASLCAMQGGRSVATTMGFTTLDGLMMGTRTGAIDPGVLLYLLRHGMDVDALENLLYFRSGLLGVSGISGDMRELERSSEASARQAIELFVYRVVCGVGEMAAGMGGIDGLVFAAGIGENSSLIRSAVCQQLAWLGVVIDEQANASHASCISAPASRLQVHIVRTDEEAMIARHACTVLSREHGPPPSAPQTWAANA